MNFSQLVKDVPMNKIMISLGVLGASAVGLLGQTLQSYNFFISEQSDE